MNNLSTLLKFAIGWPLSFLAIFFIGKSIMPKLPLILRDLHQVDLMLMLYGICSFLLYYVLRSIIWNRILTQYGYTIPFKESSFLFAYSELKRYIPGNIWSFLSRSMLFSTRGVAKKHMLNGLLVEAQLIVIGALSIGILAVPLFLRFFPSELMLQGVYLATGIFILLFLLQKTIFHRFRFSKKHIFEVVFALFSIKELFVLGITSALSFFFFGMGYYLVISSLTLLDPHYFLQFTGLFSAALLVGYLSFITPTGLGIREATIILGLSQFLSQGIAGFVALFARVVLIFTELLFIALSYALYKSKTKIVEAVEQSPQATVVGFLVTVYGIYFTSISFLRYDNFNTGRFDLGNMAQTVWNTLHGSFFTLTNPDGVEQVSRLAFHGDFILIFITPFYLLWEHPKMLLLLQTIIVAIGGIFIYLLASRILKNKNIAVIFAFLFLLNPSVERANLYDFHAVTLSTTFLLAAVYFLLQKRFIWYGVTGVLAGLTKEHVWLIVGMLGSLIYVFHKKFVVSVLWVAIGCTLFYGLIWYAIPSAGEGKHFALVYFSDTTESPSALIKDTILNPADTLDTLFMKDRINYLKQLLLPLGYLPFFAPFWLLFALPDLSLNLLSKKPELHQIFYQYTAVITPFLFLAAIYATFYINRRYKRLTLTLLGLYLLITGFVGAYQYGPLPGAKDPNLDMITKPLEKKNAIEEYLNTIDTDYSVAVSNNLGSHLSHRRNIFTLPYGAMEADYVIFLLSDSTTLKHINEHAQLIKNLKSDPRYRVDKEFGDFIAFAKKGLHK